jgi:hypothetical protein
MNTALHVTCKLLNYLVVGRYFADFSGVDTTKRQGILCISFSTLPAVRT